MTSRWPASDTVGAMTDQPIRALFDRIAAPAAATTPDLEAIGAALADLAGDLDYMRGWVDRLGEPGGLAIHAPSRGPRLMLVPSTGGRDERRARPRDVGRPRPDHGHRDPPPVSAPQASSTTAASSSSNDATSRRRRS